MDPLAQLLSLPFLIFSLLVGGVIFVFRTIVEFFWKTAVNNRAWEDLILPILPIFVGGILAYFAKMYPYGTEFASISGRVAFGSVAGGLSTILYRMMKSLIKQKIASLTGTTTTTQTTSASNAIPTMSADLHKDPS